jgi:hypothetical protein
MLNAFFDTPGQASIRPVLQTGEAMKYLSPVYSHDPCCLLRSLSTLSDLHYPLLPTCILHPSCTQAFMVIVTQDKNNVIVQAPHSHTVLL